MLWQMVHDTYAIGRTPALRTGRAYRVRRGLWVVAVRRGRLGELWMGLQAEYIPCITYCAIK